MKYEITCKFYQTKNIVEVTHTTTKNMYGKEYTVCHYTVLESEHKQAIGKTGTFLEIDIARGTTTYSVKAI